VSLSNNDIIELNEQDLPSDWADSPIPNSTVQMGSAWLQSHKSAILKVPTVVIKAQSFNYILNLSHPRSQAIIQSAQQLPYEVDQRLNK
jgi:RES domain-containing protein